jgi:hemerythrin-like metal-binding protein
MSADLTPDLLLDHPDLDRQHALVLVRLDQIADALDRPRDEIERVVSAFADELMSHLASEEALMEETLYPERGRHKSAHELFAADFLQMRDELREKGPTPVVEEWIRTRIPEWLKFHIRVNDAPLAAYLARRRPQPGDVVRSKGDRNRRLS